MKRIYDNEDSDSEWKPRKRLRALIKEDNSPIIDSAQPSVACYLEYHDAEYHPEVYKQRIERPPLPEDAPDIFHYFHHVDLPDELRREIRGHCTPATLSVLMLTCRHERGVLERQYRKKQLQLMVTERAFLNVLQYLLQNRFYNLENKFFPRPCEKQADLLHRAILYGYDNFVYWLKRPLQSNVLRHHSCISCAQLVIRRHNYGLAELFVNAIRDMVDEAVRTGRYLSRTPDVQYTRFPTLVALRQWNNSQVIDFALGSNPQYHLGYYWDDDALWKGAFT